VQYRQQHYSVDRTLFYAWFEAMYTRIDIVLCVAVKRNDLVEIVTEMEAEIRKYEKIGNRFDPQSELSEVNQHAFEKDIPISNELCKILVECQLHCNNTLGYFDISVYSTSDFPRDKKAYTINANAIRFSHPGVQLDLSGYLKGYALGKLMAISDEKGLEDVLINVGNSSIFAKGNHPFGKGWKIKVPETEREVVLHNECLTTSGNSERTKWPIMNPISGEMVKNRKPVSVITTLPDQGEVLSKVAYLAPESELESVLKKQRHCILKE